jgi:hypothetical protein
LQLFDESLNSIWSYQYVGDWIAINPVDGFLYAGSGGPNYDGTVTVYQRWFDPAHPERAYPSELRPIHSFNLYAYYSPPIHKTLQCIQGADFSPQGFLYLASDGSSRSWNGFCNDNASHAGYYVFSLNGGVSGMEAWFEGSKLVLPTDSSYEPQTVVVWDTNIRWDATPWYGWGQVHFGVRINNAAPDQVIFYHYAVPSWTF